MKSHTTKSLTWILFLFFIIFLKINLKAQFIEADTIQHTETLVPFDLSSNEPVNFPFFQAKPVGDINGDGIGDLVFTEYPADERTENPSDRVLKSIVVTDLNDPNGIFVHYESKIQGVGDFNGDGFDDLLDIQKKLILFGCNQGISEDSLQINFPDEYSTVYYYSDIDDNGKSEFYVSHNYADTILVFIGPDTTPFPLDPPNSLLIAGVDDASFCCYDYDADGETELCITGYSFFNEHHIVNWYQLDTVSKQLILDKIVNISIIHEPSTHFPSGFADINGDNKIDITHVYYKNYGLHLEVCLGRSEDPFFDPPMEVEIGNPNRFLYCAGDINNDGADDWYSKIHEDTVIIYFGHDSVITQGMNEQIYYTGDNQFILPLGPHYSLYTSCTSIPVFYFNEDTIPDLYFNYWSYNNNLQHDTIGTAIIFGGDELDFENPNILGRPKNQAFDNLGYGYRTSIVGDLNKDGFKDWGVLAHYGCYAEIYFGGEVFDHEPDVSILLPQKAKLKCIDIAGGDINGDGWDDIIISNSSESSVWMVTSMIEPRNAVYIFLGGPNWPSIVDYENADYTLIDDDTFQEFGKNLSIVGDYNADGYNDIVIGGGKHRQCLREAFLYFGGEEISTEPDRIISVPCTQCGIAFASPITPCGDINADGYDDFTLGDPNNGSGQSLVYFGGPFASCSYDLALTNPVPGGYLYGRFTARTEGDYDADGYPDLIQYNHYTGNIYVYKGGPEFNEEYDYVLFDSSVYGVSNCIDYLYEFSQPNKSDISITAYTNYDFYIFNEVNQHVQHASYVLKNDLVASGSIAAADVNNDDYTEIFVGISIEPNYGYMYGGVVQLYRSPLFVNIDESEFNESHDLFIFPNPASSEINIAFYLDFPGKVDVKLVSIEGKTICQKPIFNCVKGENIIHLNNLNIQDGSYILQLLSKNLCINRKIVFIN